MGHEANDELPDRRWPCSSDDVPCLWPRFWMNDFGWNTIVVGLHERCGWGLGTRTPVPRHSRPSASAGRGLLPRGGRAPSFLPYLSYLLLTLTNSQRGSLWAHRRPDRQSHRSIWSTDAGLPSTNSTCWPALCGGLGRETVDCVFWLMFWTALPASAPPGQTLHVRCLGRFGTSCKLYKRRSKLLCARPLSPARLSFRDNRTGPQVECVTIHGPEGETC